MLNIAQPPSGDAVGDAIQDGGIPWLWTSMLGLQDDPRWPYATPDDGTFVGERIEMPFTEHELLRHEQSVAESDTKTVTDLEMQNMRS